MKRFTVLVITVIMVFAWTGSAVAATVVGCQNSFNRATSAAEKTDALTKLLKINSLDAHLVFFSLLNQAPTTDIPLFNSVLDLAGTCQTITNLTAVTESLIALNITKVKAIIDGKTDIEQLTELEKLEVARLLTEAENSLMAFNRNKLFRLEKGFKSVASRNKACLIQSLKDHFQEISKEQNDTTFHFADPGALLGLIALKEEGFSALLESIKTDDDQTMVFMYLDRLGPYAVIPLCKQMENPASTKEQKKIAGTLLMGLPLDPHTIAKLVETYKHGRFFEATEVSSYEESFLDVVNSGWWNYFPAIYQDQEKKAFVKHVCQEYLNDPDSQHRVIRLVTETDFAIAVPYLENLPLNDLSNESLKNLFLAMDIPFTFDPEEKYIKERLDFCCFLLAKLKPERRDAQKFSMILMLGNYPVEFQKSFFYACFKQRILTARETKDALYMISKMPTVAKLETYAQIETFCTPKEKESIEYYRKKRD